MPMLTNGYAPPAVVFVAILLFVVTAFEHLYPALVQCCAGSTVSTACFPGTIFIETAAGVGITADEASSLGDTCSAAIALAMPVPAALSTLMTGGAGDQSTEALSSDIKGFGHRTISSGSRSSD